jgi:hypothetical protein
MLEIGLFGPNFTSASSAIPEPSTSAMMVLGFAGLGYAGLSTGLAGRRSFQDGRDPAGPAQRVPTLELDVRSAFAPRLVTATSGRGLPMRRS